MPEKHMIEVEDQEKVAALEYNSGDDNWIFFCHGFGDDKDRSIYRLAEEASENGFNSVVFDFRGNGESDGDFIEQNLTTRIEDLKAVIEYFDPGNYAIYGTSFGGKVVFHAAPELEPFAVIGKAPVTYNQIMDKFRDVIEEKGEFEYIDGKPIDHRFIEDLEKYDFSDVASNLSTPVAIFHGSADTTVHTKNSIEALEEFNTDTMLQKFEGEKHSFSEEAKEKMLNLMFYWLEAI